MFVGYNYISKALSGRAMMTMIPIEQVTMMASTILSNGVGNNPEIDSLTHRVALLTDSFDFWNRWMLVGLGFAALAAIWIGVTTRLAIVRSKQLTVAQGDLDAAKEGQLSLDMKQKDIEIGQLTVRSDVAEAGIAGANLLAEQEKLARVKLEAELLPRRLSGEQKTKLAKSLESHNFGVAIVSPIVDGEASDFADDFESAIHDGAHWETLRIRNRISLKFGVSIVTAKGTPALPGLKVLDDALTAIGIAHDITTVENGDASTSPQFQAGYLYLVIEHKPLPTPRHP
jgi:hypothetical protein